MRCVVFDMTLFLFVTFWLLLWPHSGQLSSVFCCVLYLSHFLARFSIYNIQGLGRHIYTNISILFNNISFIESNEMLYTLSIHFYSK
jgi:hypothetical protein